VPEADLSAMYREARVSLVGLVREGFDPRAVPVPACPGWSVHDVLSHLVAVAEDVPAGRLTGPPSDDQTAEQVARRADRPTAEVLEEWTELAGPIEDLLGQVQVWPLALDALSHEHDVRGALGRPGVRDSADVQHAGVWLLGTMSPSVPMTVHCGGTVVERGLADGEERLTLRTTPFEALRFRLGRRSRAQMAAMDWSGDPGPVLGELAIFGPTSDPIDE
jgi:uncharacterized protein (TIGR03083 family)